jgi:hypothetical protein
VEEVRIVHKVSVRKPEGKIILARPRYRWGEESCINNEFESMLEEAVRGLTEGTSPALG